MNSSGSGGGRGWQVKPLTARLGGLLRWNGPPRPADVGAALRSALLERRYLLEDAAYGKVVPNHFRVELSPAYYRQHFAPLAERLIQQWTDDLLDTLLTANSRQGRIVYRLAGPLQIELVPAPELREGDARLLLRLEASAAPDRRPLAACLHFPAAGRTFVLRAGTLTLGRSPACDLPLDLPEVRAKRLVSSRHAYLQATDDAVRLFDGALDGKPSLNGTYVNGRRVPPEGVVLQPGDHILLAAVDPQVPDEATPGAALLIFQTDCPAEEGGR
jgi:hypothetical protein